MPSPPPRLITPDALPPALAWTVVLAWIDLEMTGLDIGRDVILEVATIITDDDLRVVAEGPDLVIHQPASALEGMVPIVRSMHERSGLTEAVRASEISLRDAAATTLGFLKEHIAEPGTVPLCGNSIGTDRRFLAAQMPEVETFLHYRSVDVSTLKELTRRWHPDVLSRAPKKTSSHRALDDIRESIAELRFYRENLFPAADTP